MPDAAHPDADLVDAARAGDQQAWEQLYRRVFPRLRAYAARRVGAEHADDVVSETMIRAVGAIDRFELGAAGFDGWLFGIARRVSADHHRAAGRAARRGLKTAGGATTDEAVDEGLVKADEHEQIRRLFGQLNESERELLELRIIAGLSADAAAVALGKRPGAVRTAQSRALARLRSLLESDDG